MSASQCTEFMPEDNSLNIHLPSINDPPDQLLICNATAEKAERIGFIHRFALLFPF